MVKKRMLGQIIKALSQTYIELGSDIDQYYHPLIDLPDPEDEQFPNETVWMLKKPLLKSTFDQKKPRRMEKVILLVNQ